MINAEQNTDEASLFGLKNSNRDFSSKDAWGKNQFNSSFPAALCCYLDSKKADANYLVINDSDFIHQHISIEDAFGMDPFDDDIYFAFETAHSPFQQYVIGSLPRTDLVIQKKSTGQCLAGLEVKLTALPDNTTCMLSDDAYGSEIVIRPDTIVYLACSIASNLGERLKGFFHTNISIADWTDARQVLSHVSKMVQVLREIIFAMENVQTPFLLQPVWKTEGKSPRLAEHCLDVFFWSDAGFAYFITEIANPQAHKITRATRTAIWLYKMLLDITIHGRFDHEKIIDTLSYNTKNDKAFAASGTITNPFMASPRLTTPLITKDEIKHIILGGGQNLLSPERRFDAIIYNSPEIFQ